MDGSSPLDPSFIAGDYAWILASSALVFLMIPGVGFFYSGIGTRRSTFSIIFLSLMSVSVVSFQWFFWGYSLAFSTTGRSGYIANLRNIGFRHVLGDSSSSFIPIPELVFALYQGMFAIFTVAVVTGATAERGRVLPCIVFMFVWATLVYDPIACWSWNSNGWLSKQGSLDWAGGSPVHISSGAASLAYSWVLGPRHYPPDRPGNVLHMILGTIMLWFGWFGFNAGSALKANLRATMAFYVSSLAAGVGGFTWCFFDRVLLWFHRTNRDLAGMERKLSITGFCSGVIAGLVAITPGAGYVPAWSALIFGFVGAIVCNLGQRQWTKNFFNGSIEIGRFILKSPIKVEDVNEIFVIHAFGGLAGLVLTGLFATKNVAALDGFADRDKPLGWLDKHYIQLGYQLADATSCFIYSFVVTAIIVKLMNLVPGLSLRVTDVEEGEGIDVLEFNDIEALMNNQLNRAPPIEPIGSFNGTPVGLPNRQSTGVLNGAPNDNQEHSALRDYRPNIAPNGDILLQDFLHR